MGLVLLTSGITIISIVLMIIFKDSLICAFMTVSSIVVLAFVLVFIPICRNDTACSIAEFKARTITIQEQRAIASDYERVMLTKEIIDGNAWLSSVQYCASNKWISIYFGQEVLDLKPIK